MEFYTVEYLQKYIPTLNFTENKSEKLVVIVLHYYTLGRVDISDGTGDKCFQQTIIINIFKYNVISA